MKAYPVLLLILVLGICRPSAAQNVPNRSVSWIRLIPNLAHDQEQIWRFPISLARGNHLKPAIIFVGVTAGLAAVADSPVADYFSRTKSFGEFNRAFSARNTSIGMFAFPSAFYAVGVLRKDTYAEHTFLLAGEAVLDSEILTSVMKDTDRRLNPGNIPPGGDFSATWFKKTQGSFVGGVGSFPSGHGIAAFSIATVFADRYSRPGWHRWAAYSLAALVGFSRLSLQSHFTSDAFAGGVLGYVIAHQAALHAAP